MRCFTALRFEPLAGPALDGWLAETRSRFPELAVTPPGNLHLTLVFLGELEAAQVEAAAGAVAEAALGVGRFDLGWGAPGVFPGATRPRVLWLGVGEGAPAVAAVQRRLAEALVGAGLAVEDRAFRPHLTLARVRRAGLTAARLAAVESWLETVPTPAPPVASGVALYRSLLGAADPVYSVIGEAGFRP